MPQINFTQSVAAGATYYPLERWQYRLPPKPATVELLINAAATGCVMAFTTGPESIVQTDTHVSAGGVANVLPARLNTEPIVDAVLAMEELVLAIRNTTGAAVNVQGTCILTYV